jgi:hypothetical protein
MNRDQGIADAATDRWRAGRAARGLAPDAPFQGDPIQELAEELADAWNYVYIAGRDGHISNSAVFRISEKLAASWGILLSERGARDAR